MEKTLGTEAICPQCQKPFIKKRNQHVYCSRSCASLGYYYRTHTPKKALAGPAKDSNYREEEPQIIIPHQMMGAIPRNPETMAFIIESQKTTIQDLKEQNNRLRDKYEKASEARDTAETELFRINLQNNNKSGLSGFLGDDPAGGLAKLLPAIGQMLNGGNGNGKAVGQDSEISSIFASIPQEYQKAAEEIIRFFASNNAFIIDTYEYLKAKAGV